MGHRYTYHYPITSLNIFLKAIFPKIRFRLSTAQNMRQLALNCKKMSCKMCNSFLHFTEIFNNVYLIVFLIFVVVAVRISVKGAVGKPHDCFHNCRFYCLLLSRFLHQC